MSACLQIGTLALQYHQLEKLEAFRNAALNSASPGGPDDFEQETFIRYLDELTPLHLAVLSFFDDPGSRIVEHPDRDHMTIEPVQSIVAEAFPDLAERRDVVEQISRDLTRARVGRRKSSPLRRQSAEVLHRDDHGQRETIPELHQGSRARVAGT